MIFSTDIKELFTALSMAQGEFPPIPKSGYNPHFKAKFSTLDDYERSCRSITKKYGLGWSQVISHVESSHMLITILFHSSGQWIQSTININPPKNDPQSLGVYITYMRRYALSAILGVSGSEDDDGNSLQDEERISVNQYNELVKDIKAHTEASKILKDILSFNKIDKLEELPNSSFSRVKYHINKNKTS